MNSLHRAQSRAKHNIQALYHNPVAVACRNANKARADAEFSSQLLDTRIKALSAVEGEDATDLLASFAVVIGTPCEAGARQYGAVPWVNQLHGALRTIVSICLDGYKWQDRYALALNRALEIAGENRDELDDWVYREAYIEACQLSEHILAHTVTADSVAIGGVS